MEMTGDHKLSPVKSVKMSGLLRSSYKDTERDILHSKVMYLDN